MFQRSTNHSRSLGATDLRTILSLLVCTGVGFFAGRFTNSPALKQDPETKIVYRDSPSKKAVLIGKKAKASTAKQSKALKTETPKTVKETETAKTTKIKEASLSDIHSYYDKRLGTSQAKKGKKEIVSHEELTEIKNNTEARIEQVKKSLGIITSFRENLRSKVYKIEDGLAGKESILEALEWLENYCFHKIDKGKLNEKGANKHKNLIGKSMGKMKYDEKNPEILERNDRINLAVVNKNYKDLVVINNKLAKVIKHLRSISYCLAETTTSGRSGEQITTFGIAKGKYPKLVLAYIQSEIPRIP